MPTVKMSWMDTTFSVMDCHDKATPAIVFSAHVCV